MSDREEVTPEKFEVIKAILGADAETFKRTKLGQYIFDRIENEEHELIEKLIFEASKCADPKMIQIALDIQMRRTLPKFVDEAIQSGHAAERNIEQMETTQIDY